MMKAILSWRDGIKNRSWNFRKQNRLLPDLALIRSQVSNPVNYHYYINDGCDCHVCLLRKKKKHGFGWLSSLRRLNACGLKTAFFQKEQKISCWRWSSVWEHVWQPSMRLNGSRFSLQMYRRMKALVEISLVPDPSIFLKWPFSNLQILPMKSNPFRLTRTFTSSSIVLFLRQEVYSC